MARGRAFKRRSSGAVKVGQGGGVSDAVCAVKTKTSLLVTLAGILAFLSAGPAPAGSPDQEMHLQLGYDGRLLVKVLDIEVDARVDRTGFGAEAQLTSSGILALVKHIHQVASSQGRIEGGEARPGDFQTQNLGGKTHRRIHTVWRSGEVSMTAQPAFDNLGEPPASPQQKLAAADPLTQLIRLTLDGSREKTCSRSYLFFDGKQLYALDFGPAEDASLAAADQQLGLTAPFRCDVRYREVAGFKKKPPNKKNQGLKHPIELRFARLGTEGPLLITSLSAETPLGKAGIELVRLRASGHMPTRPGTALVAGLPSGR